MLTLLLLVLSADDSAKLTLVPNATEILQRDNLLLLSVLENKSISAVHVMLDGSDSGGGRIWHEIQDKDDRWVKIRAAVDQVSEFCGIRGSLVMAGESAYAECEAIHRRSLKGAFLFENPGTYKIRAVVKMPWGDLPSEPVLITVKERPWPDLKMIESIPPKDLWALGRPSPGRPLPESLLKLKSVSGNIARTMEQWEMAEVACEGGKWRDVDVAKEKSFRWMQKNMDPVAYEHSLDALGYHYLVMKRWEELPRVVNAMKYDSSHKRSFIGQLRVLTRPPTPAIP